MPPETKTGPPEGSPDLNNNNQHQHPGADGVHYATGGLDGTEAMRRYFDACFRDTTGWLLISHGHEPLINNQGKYKHKAFNAVGVRWPNDEADGIISLLVKESREIDVWVCPYLMTHNRRAKGESVSRLTAHADIDQEPFDSAKADKLSAIGGFAIASGSHGHVHVYLPLTRSVSVEQHKALCIGLGKYIGGADPAKHSDNDLLRPPGTYNHKSRVFDGKPPTPVRWLT